MIKILVIQTASIGDVILATPVLEGIHGAFPSAETDILVKKGMEGLFRGHPFITNVISWDKSVKYKDFIRIFRLVRRRKYDLVINVQRFALTGLLTALSGAKSTVGFSKNPFWFLFTKRIRHMIGKGIHEVERNVSLLTPFIPTGMRVKEFTNAHKPKLYPSKTDEAAVAKYKGKPFVTISPASLWFTKQYPSSKWVELIDTFPGGISIFLLGSGSDAGLCEEIISASGSKEIISLAGLLTLLESAALLKDALMNYTNDSAPMHLASSVNAPVSVVYCSTIPEFGFGPLSEKQWIIQSDKALKCRPCGLHGKNACPLQHFDCAFSIRSDQFPLLTIGNPKI
jgi:ADP-heptose:LPS heptosyltransferase